MRTIADKYIDEGIEKGIVQGIEVGKQQGIQIGEAKGKAEGKYEVAKNMLAAGSDIAFISKVTGLSNEQIQQLKNN